MFTWAVQVFVFRVPPEAVAHPKLYSIRVKLQDFDGPMKKVWKTASDDGGCHGDGNSFGWCCHDHENSFG